MNDRFKFRLWHKPLKMMHYNDFVITSTGYVAPIQEEVKGIDYMMRFNQQDLEFDKQCVVMQCTGLKDKNGKLIYEGDIVKETLTEFIDEEDIIVVKWDTLNTMYNLDNSQNCEREVIGNIYENKELFKNKG